MRCRSAWPGWRCHRRRVSSRSQRTVSVTATMAANGSRMRAVGCRSASRSRPRRFLPRRPVCAMWPGVRPSAAIHTNASASHENSNALSSGAFCWPALRPWMRMMPYRCIRVCSAFHRPATTARAVRLMCWDRQHCAREHDGTPGEGASTKVEVAFVAVDQGEGERLVRERDQQRRRHQPGGAVRVVSEQPSGSCEWDPTERQRNVDQTTVALQP